MNKIFHNKYWGIDLKLNDNSNLFCTLQCFGEYNTIIEFDLDEILTEYYIEDTEVNDILFNERFSILSEDLFKSAYFNFLWIRSNIYTLSSLFAETSFWESLSYNSAGITEKDLNLEINTRIISLEIKQLNFFLGGSFSVDYTINKESYSLTFNSDREIDYF
ncbi:hypothetical protein [Clostridium culturomicium]|uniref:hypothetical protein n=1 Tax=Clostridium culturomicium TaxID=1499683 RepID=UPI0038577138